jgi:excisionase family DNA binding protein
MMTVRQVADFLHVSVSTVRRWSNGGTLRSCRIGSRGDRRYDPDDGKLFLEESVYRPVGGFHSDTGEVRTLEESR